LVAEGYDPLHAAYIAAQNLASLFAETFSQFDEMAPYCEIAGTAQEEYLPEGKPAGPLTHSCFTTWAFFDLRFGADQETVGSCILDLSSLGSLLGIEPRLVQAIRAFQQSRMGIYEHMGARGARCMLKELLTGKKFVCYPASGYKGKRGELWYVRLLPPLDASTGYHVVFTTPYVLLYDTTELWTAYLKKAIVETGVWDPRDGLHDFMKYGRGPDFWHRYIRRAYVRHEFQAVFLASLPEAAKDLPRWHFMKV
jgi:hypothetical protein